MIKYIAILFAVVSVSASAGLYINGTKVDSLVCKPSGSSVYCITSAEKPPEPPPVQPPDPPATDCPPTRVPVTATLDLSNPGPQQMVAPSPWIATPLIVGSGAKGTISFGTYQGNDSLLKTAAITRCPIVSNEHLVSACYANGSSTVNLSYGTSRCNLPAGRYYLMFGAKSCSGTQCRSVRNIYR